MYMYNRHRILIITEFITREIGRDLTKRLRNDLGRSVGVTTVTQLVWLTG